MATHSIRTRVPEIFFVFLVCNSNLELAQKIVCPLPVAIKPLMTAYKKDKIWAER